MSLDIVDAILENEKEDVKEKVAAAPKSKGPGLRYITEEEWFEMGSPSWGYTTARSKQWKYKTEGYWEAIKDYHVAAIKFVKLARHIRWYSSTDEAHLNKCRQEIARFRKDNNLTEHDFREVLDIVYRGNYRRRTIINMLLTVKGATRKDIPKNVTPTTYYVDFHESLTIDNGDIFDMAVSEALGETKVDKANNNKMTCSEHPNNKGLRRPRNGCPTCLKIYEINKKSGVKERRAGR